MVMQVSRARLRSAGAFPRSHVVGKQAGDGVVISWAILNEDGPTTARLELHVDNIDLPGNVTLGLLRAVAPGVEGTPSRTPLTLDYIVPLATPSGSYTAHLRMWETDLAGAHIGGEVDHHQWQLNVSGLGEANIVPVGDPVIS